MFPGEELHFYHAHQYLQSGRRALLFPGIIQKFRVRQRLQWLSIEDDAGSDHADRILTVRRALFERTFSLEIPGEFCSVSGCSILYVQKVRGSRSDHGSFVVAIGIVETVVAGGTNG